MKFFRLTLFVVAALLVGVFLLRSKPESPQPVAPAMATPELAVPVPAWPVAAPVARRAAGREVGRETGSAALDAFNKWAARYVALPENARAKLVDEGIALASARRTEMRAMIERDPRRALENAVPPVVRQELPRAVADRLEERVNEAAFFGVLGAVPMEGVETPAYRREVMTDDGGRYRAFVYGAKLAQPTTERASIVGIAVDDVVAVDERPLRVVEPGEIPNHPNNRTQRRTVIATADDGFVSDPVLKDGVGDARAVVEACPVSGIETPAPRSASGEFEAVAPQQAVVEAGGKFIFLCSGGHIHALEEQLAAEGGNGGPIKPTNPPAATNSTGYRTHLLMRIAFPETRRESITEKEGHDLGKNVQDWFVDSSFGAMTMLTTVTPVIVLPRSEAWYKNVDTGGSAYEVLSDGRAAAKAAGFDPANFDLDTVIYTGAPGSFGGQAYVGGKGCWLKSGTGTGVAAHEYGHNFGLWHANFWNTANGSPIGGGAHVEYGDNFDTMGSASAGDLQFNACHKNILNWLPTAFVHSVGQSGTYRVHQMDQPRLDPRLRYALKVRKDAARDYWVDLRQKFASNAWVQGGVFLHWDPWATSAGGSHLLDTTPGSLDGKTDAPIVIGRTFSDVESDIHITPVAKNATSPPSVDVTVNVGPFPTNQTPAMSLAASAASVAANAPVTFTTTATDADGDALAYAWDFGDKSFSTANTPVVTKAWTAAGEYRVRCVVSDMKGRTASASVLVTVGAPGTFRIAGTITDGALPLQHVRVTAGTRETYTDSDGSYTLTGLAAGSHTVGAQLYAYSLAPTGSATVSVGPNATVDFTGAAQSVVSISLHDADCAEGANTGTIRFSRTGSTAAALAVNFLSPGGTATGTTDYTPALGTSATIPSGAAFVDVVVTAVDDTATESFETVIVEVQPATTYVLGTALATLFIADSDTPKPLVRLRVTDRDADESGDAAQFLIERIGPTTSALGVSVAMTGTAGNGADYASIPATITIPAGASSVPVNVTPNQDAAIEGMETVILTISTNTNYIRATATADYTGTANLHDDDEPILTVVATDAAAAEAASDPGVFSIARTGSTAAALTVNYGVTGSALHGTDYVALPGVLTIPAGSSIGTIVITPVDDAIGEPAQTARLYLRGGTGYAIGSPGDATVTITDNNDLPYVAVSTTASAKESGTAGTFKITTTGTGSGNITVRYTISGTATNSVDFTTLSGTLSVARNITANVTVTALQDLENEGYETVTLTLTPDAAYSLAVNSEATLIIEDDELPQVNVSTTNASFGETAGSLAKFFISRTGSTAGALTVAYTMSGTATSGVDYTAPTGSVTIPAAATGAYVDVSMLADTLSEGTETVTLNVTPDATYSLGFGSATRYLPDAQTTLPTVSFSPTTSSAAESAGTVNLNVTLSAAQAGDVSVEWFTNGGTALGGNVDYVTTSGVLTFIAGETAQTIPLTINDDTLDEADATVVIALRNPNGARLGSASHTVTITDNDTPPAATVGFASPAASAGESVPLAQIAVALSTAQTSAVTVDYAVTGGTVDGADYTIAGSTLTFAVGETVKIIPITIINDEVLEPGETIILSLSNAVGATLNPNATHTYTIADDDAVTVTLAATDASAGEPGNDGAFTLTRTGTTASALTVNLTIAGSATNGADYSTIASTVDFLAGQSTVVVPVAVIDDTVGEANETVQLTIASGGYTVGVPNSATVNLADDEPLVTLAATDAAAREGGDTGTISVVRTGSTANPLTVNVSVTGTATAGSDYDALVTPVVIPAGASSAPLVVMPIEDVLVEPAETVIVTVTAGPYLIGVPGSVSVTISDNEPVVTIAATDASAEEPADSGSFTITRAETAPDPLTVLITITGTATNGTDYTALASPVTIAANETSATLTVAPIDDPTPEGSETVIVTLIADAAYSLGAQASATVTLIDDDVNNAPVITLTSPTVTNVAIPNTTTGLLLEATATDDGKPVVPGALTTAWTKVSGPGTVTFDDASAPTTGALFSANGVYVLRLTADDGAIQTTKEVRVTVAPTVAATLQAGNIGTGASGGSYVQNGGTFTLTGNGSSITSDSSDGFYFVWQTMPGGAWEVIARVASISGGSTSSSRAGIMARTGTGSADVEAFIGVTTDSRLSWVRRATAGGSATATNTNNLGAPRWVRLVRSGANFSGYHSVDGVNWTLVSTEALASATDPMLVGLATTNAAALTNAVAAFTDVNIALTNNTGASVNAGANLSAIAGQPRNLDGTITDDGKPVQSGPVVPLWTTRSGSGGATFGDAGATDTTVIFDTAGSYVLRLIAHDSQVKTFDDTSGTVTISTLSIGIVPGGDGSELGPTDGYFYVQRDDTVGELIVNFAVSGTATPGVDFVALPATGIMPDGVDFIFGPITPIADALVEGAETVTLTLLPGSGYIVGAANSDTIDILDAPLVSVAASASASEVGLVNGAFIFTRTGSTAQALTIPFTVSGTATPLADCAALPASVTIPVGAASVMLEVVPLADAAPEGIETIDLTITADPAQYIIATAAATVAIGDLPIDHWRHFQFGPDAANPVIAGDLADPDGDGLRNLLEYGFNTDPLTPNPAPVLAYEGSDLVLIYRRHLAATDVIFDLRATADFATWTDAGESEQILSDDGTTRTIRAQLPAPAGPQSFYRIEVTRPAQ